MTKAQADGHPRGHHEIQSRAKHASNVEKHGHAHGPEKPVSSNQLIITHERPELASQVTDETRQLLFRAMLKSHVNHLMITSANRTAHDQARIMYDNLIHGKRINYKKPGQAVTHAFDTAPHKKNAAETIALMEAEVVHQGLTNVTNHGADPHVLNTIDVAPSSIPKGKHEAFKKAIESERGHAVKQFLHPGNSKDPAFHIAVRQAPPVPAKKLP